MSSVSHDLDEGKKFMVGLREEIEGSKETAADLVAHKWADMAKRVMASNGNVVTGEGARSLEVRNLGSAASGVYGLPHLLALETGTSPHEPNQLNNRFILAAKDYGMDKERLAQVIADQGTDAHEWMDETTRKTRRKIPRTVNPVINEAVEKAKK